MGYLGVSQVILESDAKISLHIPPYTDCHCLRRRPAAARAAADDRGARYTRQGYPGISHFRIPILGYPNTSFVDCVIQGYPGITASSGYPRMTQYMAAGRFFR